MLSRIEAKPTDCAVLALDQDLATVSCHCLVQPPAPDKTEHREQRDENMVPHLGSYT